MTDSAQQSVYNENENEQAVERRTIAVLADNEFGVLGRIVNLFSGRGYNIESLTVSEVDKERRLSRITIVTSGTSAVITQIEALLRRLVPVHKTRDLTISGPHVERGVGLVKIVNESQKARDEAQHIATQFSARTVDSTPTSFIFELSDTPETMDNFLNQLAPYGVVEVCRTGITAMSRGAEFMDID